MRYQERIYVRNDFRGVRNKDILNVSMSSDFAIFKSPSFGLSGATKVPCGTITCDFSGVPFNDIFNSAATECLTATTTVVNTFLSADWYAKIYEDNLLTYSGHFYTSAFSGDLPTNTAFLTKVTNGLDVLNYIYEKEDTKLMVQKPFGGTKTLDYDICIGFDINRYTCPAGFSATPANDNCEKIDITGATYNGSSGTTITAGDVYPVYGYLGTTFYTNIQNSGALPFTYPGTGYTLTNQTGGTVSPIVTANTGTFWFNNSTFTDGRLNNVGIITTNDGAQWVGFSECININEAGTYYIGLAADNFCQFSVDGQLVVALTGNSLNQPVLPCDPNTTANPNNYAIWSVFEWNFTSGKHIITMLGLNQCADPWPGGGGTLPGAPNPKSFAAEIYKPVSLSALTAATSTGETGLIFSTFDKIGDTFSVGDTIGYSCPNGYVLSDCDALTPTCQKFEFSSITATTAHCLDDCIVYCGDSFPYVDNTTVGTYIIDPSLTTEIPLTFYFTGNTSSFLLNDVSFKYEIYKYRNNLGIFTVPAVYTSDVIQYSAITTAFTLNQLVPISGLQLDGQYLVKGYFEGKIRTPFLKKLNKVIDTSVYKQNGQYQLYDANLDYYFIAMTQAEKPNFLGITETPENTSIDSTTLYQEVIIVDDSAFNIGTTIPEYGTGPQYTRTGSVFSLQSEYLGDVLVTLNGLTLSKNIDYTLSGTILTMFGPITNGDVITIIYTSTPSSKIITQPILLNTTIPSGTTNNQGNNSYYFNTTTGKYEIYLTNEPVDNTNIIVVLNGITLINNIDYYQSTSNKKRIILNGVIIVGDIISAIYYPKATTINGITQTNNNIPWDIQNGPLETNGQFTLEYSNSPLFSTYNIAAVVPYQQFVTTYNAILSLSGDVGTTYYYRVKNEKNNVSMCGDIISSTAYSETVKVVVQTNAINSY